MLIKNFIGTQTAPSEFENSRILFKICNLWLIIAIINDDFLKLEIQ